MSKIEFRVQNMVRTHKGTIPILLTCGHGGTKEIPGVPERNGSNIPDICKRQFEKDTDKRTLPITNGLAQQIRKLTNGDPYRVEFLGDRLYIDVNREKKCGCEVSQAEIHFEAYHSAISQFVQEIRNNNTCGNGLVFLFDIHGKRDNTTDISVGTRDESTIEPMVKFNPGWGWDYKFGLLELLIKRGYSITPGAPCAEDDIRFPGGYTVRRHGGWQIEISLSIRDSPSKRERLVKNLAEIISIFYKHNCLLPM
jgi:hypothetical protein